MSLALKLDAARVRRFESPAAVRLATVAGVAVQELPAFIAPPVKDVAPAPVVVALVPPSADPEPEYRPGFFRRTCTAGNKTFAIIFIVVAYISLGIVGPVIGWNYRVMSDAKATALELAGEELLPPPPPRAGFNRITGKRMP